MEEGLKMRNALARVRVSVWVTTSAYIDYMLEISTFSFRKCRQCRQPTTRRERICRQM